MMTRPLFVRVRRRSLQDDRVLPLINVVFLLLIFFMLAGRLAASDPFPVQPPESASTVSDAPGKLVVHVAADGRLAVNGAAVSPGGLGAVIAGREQAGSVQVKADARTEALAVVRVLEWLREAGIDRVQLVTQARGG